MNFIKSGLIKLMHVSPEDLAEVYGVEDDGSLDITKALDRISSIADNKVFGKFVKPEQREMLKMFSENKEVIKDVFALVQDGTRMLGMR